MTKLIKTISVAVFLVMTAITSTLAQKYGHINAGNLLETFPEVQKADSTLQQMQAELSVKGQQMVKKFEADYTKYAQESQEGKIPPVQAKKIEEDLQRQQQDIDKYREEIAGQLEKKRQELLKPILERIDVAIKSVGKENGYSMIFDISTGAMLYAMDSQDISPLVKAKLGLK